MTLSIGLDADGCFYDFTLSMIEYAREVGTPGCESFDYPDRWNTWECWGMTQDAWMDLFREGVAAGKVFRSGQPVGGAVEVIRALKDEGHSIHIVTHRNVHCRAIQSTGEFLEEHDVPYDSLTFAQDKTVVPVDIFLEDNVDNYWALWDTGVTTPVIFDQPWNRDDENLARVHSWAEFHHFVRDHDDD